MHLTAAASPPPFTAHPPPAPPRVDARPWLQLSMIFANQSEADIIAKDRLEALAKAHPNNFSVTFIVDKTTNPAWKGATGYITKELLQKHMPPPSDDSLVLVCGPPPMMKAISGDKVRCTAVRRGAWSPRCIILFNRWF